MGHQVRTYECTAWAPWWCITGVAWATTGAWCATTGTTGAAMTPGAATAKANRDKTNNYNRRKNVCYRFLALLSLTGRISLTEAPNWFHLNRLTSLNMIIMMTVTGGGGWREHWKCLLYKWSWKFILDIVCRLANDLQLMTNQQFWNAFIPNNLTLNSYNKMN